MKKICLLALCLVVTSFMVTGCGPGVSEDMPITEVKQEARAMDVNQLKSMVGKYQQVIVSKKPVLEKLKTKLKAIPITQLMSEEAGALKKDMGDVVQSIKALTDRMKIYLVEFNKRK
ncbi:MAG: hypothetical protein KAI70_04315 [Candidatus Omnitrophica bacterium]|nr:hypothetical protein [Candidatus Omnitrophota bacterium]